MKLKLEHLLYTSRLSFETIAASRGIDRRLRTQLERWASDYPVKTGDGRDAPLVMRGFPLEGTDGAWGVMILCYTGADMSRSEGNYLAHAFVVPGSAWRELAGNAAWVVAHVPFWGTYRSPSGAGQDEIEPIEFEIDAARQLRFARLLLEEQGRTRLARILTDTLAQLQGAPRENVAWAIPFGGVPTNLDALLAAFAEPSEPSLPVPLPDVFNVWRTAGLLALLPSSFASRASFSINELETGSRYRLTVLRGDSGKADSDVVSGTFVNWCLDRLEQKQPERLLALRAWLERHLKSPSSSALDGLTELYELLQAVEPAVAPSETSIMALLGAIRRAGEGAAIDEFAMGALRQIATLEADQRRRLMTEFASVLGNSQTPLSAPLLDALLEQQKMADGAIEVVRLESFPGPLRAQLYEHLLSRADSPRTLAPPAGLKVWALRQVAPHQPRERQEQHAAQALQSVWQAANPERGIEELTASLTALHEKVRTSVFDEVMNRVGPTERAFGDFVQAALGSGTPSVETLQALTMGCRVGVDRLLMIFPPSREAAGYQQFLGGLRAVSGRDQAEELELYQELCSLVARARTANEQLLRGSVADRSAPSSYREGSRPSSSFIRSPDEWEQVLRENRNTGLRVLEAPVCTRQRAFGRDRPRSLLLHHLTEARRLLDPFPFFVLMAAYVDELSASRCFDTISKLLRTLREALDARHWLDLPRVELDGIRVRPLDCVCKVLVAASADEELDAEVAITLDRLAYEARRDLFPELSHHIHEDVLKRWQKLVSARPLTGHRRLPKEY